MFHCSTPSKAFTNLKKKLEAENYTQGIPVLREGESEEIIEWKQQQQRKFLIEEYLDAVLKEEEAYFRSVGMNDEDMNVEANDFQPTLMEQQELFANCEEKRGKTRTCCQSTTETPVNHEMGKESFVSTPVLLQDTFSASPPPTTKKRGTNKKNSAKSGHHENIKANRKKIKGYEKVIKLHKHPSAHSERKYTTPSSQCGSSLVTKIAPRNNRVKSLKGKTCRIRKETPKYGKEKYSRLIPSEFNVGFLPETNLHEKKWNAKALELIEYKRKFGHCDVPQLDPDFGQLGRWLRTQRIAYKGKREGRGEMSDQRILLLETIGVKWECKRGKSR